MVTSEMVKGDPRNWSVFKLDESIVRIFVLPVRKPGALDEMTYDVIEFGDGTMKSRTDRWMKRNLFGYIIDLDNAEDAHVVLEKSVMRSVRMRVKRGLE